MRPKCNFFRGSTYSAPPNTLAGREASLPPPQVGLPLPSASNFGSSGLKSAPKTNSWLRLWLEAHSIWGAFSRRGQKLS